VKKTAPKKAAPKKAAPAKAEAKPKAVEAVAEEVVETPAPQPPAAGFDVTDSARELAEEAGIDLASIEGTGKEGRILKSDVQKAIKERDEA